MSPVPCVWKVTIPYSSQGNYASLMFYVAEVCLVNSSILHAIINVIVL